jgi:holo-[acyl-carrier protein] synthase
MIYGLGTDIVEVQRIAAKLAKPDFITLVFTPGEIAYCEQQVHKAEHYAARFAAKEAYLKAQGTGWGNHGGVNFNQIEISHNPAGKPLLTLIGDAATRYTELHISQILVSLSHTSTMATATVIIETTE